MRTYLDSGVLIAAAHGSHAAHLAAMSVLDDSTRTFIASDFVQLEILPKAQYHQQTNQAAFYEEYLRAVHLWVLTTPLLITLAMQRAREFGLNGMDALLLAAAELGGAEELVTSEKPTRPFFRVTTLRIVSIHP